MKGILGYLGSLYVLSLGATALAQTEAPPIAAESGGVPQPPAAATAPPPAVAPAASAAPAQPAAQSGVPASAGFAVDSEVPPAAVADEDEEPSLQDQRDLDDELRFRAQNSWNGPTGGVRVIDASSGPPGTARLQFGFDYFSATDYLVLPDTNESLGGIMSLSVTPIEHLELFASVATHANSNPAGQPTLLQVAGDVVVGGQGFKQVLPWLGLGADLRVMFLNTIGDLGVVLKGTSVGFRGAATADLRRIREPLPVLVRAKLEYLLDNSSELIEGIEAARYDDLALSMRKPIENEHRHLVTRIERFALGINRVDMISIGLGAEAPFQVMPEFFLQPLVEWRLGIPVNRQGYSCLAVSTTAAADGQDSCLAIEGLAAAPSTLTFGLRVLPPLRGFAALLAFDVGVLGTSTFVRELAPNRPWAFMLAASYAIDARPAKPQIQYVQSAAPPITPAPPKARLRGTVVERGFGTGIVGAIVRYPDFDFSPQLTAAEGRFVSYELEPGDVTLEITHPDYDSGRCSAKIPPQPQPAAATLPDRSGLQPPAAAASGGPSTPGQAAGAFVDLRCELTARPRSGAIRGSVTDEKDAPVTNQTVEITGPSPQTVVTDGAGNFTLAGLPVGDYVARVDAPSYLLKTQPFSVTNSGEVNLTLTLVTKPKDAAVTLTAREVKIRDQIMFKTNSAEIDERSTGLLSQIADILLRNPQVAQVQVQGHTDNQGDPETNLQLSQQRAEAVVAWLVGAGVGSERLEAKGYGDARPLVPNLTPGNRARNRRVQFIVKDQ